MHIYITNEKLTTLRPKKSDTRPLIRAPIIPPNFKIEEKTEYFKMIKRKKGQDQVTPSNKEQIHLTSN